MAHEIPRFELIERYEGTIQQMGEDMAGLERDLKGKRAQITRLKAELAQRQSEHRFRTHADEVFEVWRKEIHPKARAFSGDRLKNVLARLAECKNAEGEEEPLQRRQELIEAVHGAKLGAYQDPKTGVRYDDLELICRSDRHVRRFRQLYQAQQADPTRRAKAPTPTRENGREGPQKPHHKAPPIAWVLYRIELAGQWWVQAPDAGRFYFPCPRHGLDGILAWAQEIGEGRTFVRLGCLGACAEDDVLDGYCIPATELFST